MGSSLSKGTISWNKNPKHRANLNTVGSEYQAFEYQKHLNIKLFEVHITNSLVFKWSVYVLSPMSVYVPYVIDQQFKFRKVLGKQDGIHLSGFQMAFKYPTIWHPNSFRPFQYQTSLVFRFGQKHSNTVLLKVWYLNESSIQVSRVVYIGRLTAFYVVLVPLELIPSEPPLYAYVIILFCTLQKGSTF